MMVTLTVLNVTISLRYFQGYKPPSVLICFLHQDLLLLFLYSGLLFSFFRGLGLILNFELLQFAKEVSKQSCY